MVCSVVCLLVALTDWLVLVQGGGEQQEAAGSRGHRAVLLQLQHPAAQGGTLRYEQLSARVPA